MHELARNEVPLILDKNHYTLSLLRKGVLEETLSMDRQREIKRVLDKEFKEFAEQYVNRESGSLQTETAEKIYASVLYQSDAFFREIGSEAGAEEAIRKLPMEKILAAGKEIVVRYMGECKAIYSKARALRLMNVSMPEYDHAMGRGFAEFSKRYSPRFHAEEIGTAIDYPLLNLNPYEMPETGVVFMKKYYTYLLYENKFCAFFDKREIPTVLDAYGRLYRCVYSDLHFNICEIIALRYFARGLLKMDTSSLFFEEEHLHELYKVCDAMTETELAQKVKRILISDERFLKEPAMMQYFWRYASRFTGELYTHVKQRTLDKWIPIG